MSIKGFVLLVAVVLGGAVSPAAAYDVFINGVKVTGALRDVSFDKVNLRFDAKGDIHVDAPGYKIEAPAAPAQPPPVAAAPPPSVRYWLVVNAAQTGHYTVRVQANGRPVVDIPATSPQYVADLTDKLQQGANAVEVTFMPLPDAPVVPKTEAVNVLVGMGGQAPDGTLTISKVLGTSAHPTGKAAAQAHVIKFDLN